jgi:hypothetical protein
MRRASIEVLTICILCIGVLMVIERSEALHAQQTSTTAAFRSVKGRVVDEQGDALPGAKVYADPVEVKDIPTGKMHFVITKEDGGFTLEQVLPGTNLICASKEEAFFPDTGVAAFALNLDALPRVRVAEARVIADVTVQLTKGGKLVGSISDSLNGQPLPDSGISSVQNRRSSAVRLDGPRRSGPL